VSRRSNNVSTSLAEVVTLPEHTFMLVVAAIVATFKIYFYQKKLSCDSAAGSMKNAFQCCNFPPLPFQGTVIGWPWTSSEGSYSLSRISASIHISFPSHFFKKLPLKCTTYHLMEQAIAIFLAVKQSTGCRRLVIAF